MKQIFPNKEFKEAFYKYVLGFSGDTDVFNSGRKKSIDDFNISPDTRLIIDDVKKYVMEVLYK